MQKLRELLLKYPQTALILIISIVYLYFQLDMMLRTTGDEKTYVAQALEMHRDGHWFLQTLFNEPDYYKGPLHFLFLRLGFIILGTHSIFATLYMNFFGLIVAMLLLYNLFVKEFADKGWALFYASSFSLSIGLYSHMFASQMEAELVICYATVLYLLNRLESDNRWRIHLLLWFIIGITGWLKSPAYSVFLALSVPIYWVFTAQLKSRLQDKKTYLSLFFGIFIGFTGYLPILYYNGDVFIDKYIIKESLSKGANGVPWTAAFFPIFTYFLAPWMFASIFSYMIAIYTLFVKKARILSENELRLVKLSLSLIIPTLTFFTLHQYRGDIYALPLVSATMLISYIYWRAYTQKFAQIYIWMMRLSALVLSSIPFAIIILYIHLEPMPLWWPVILLPLSVFALLFTLGFIFYESENVAKNSPLLLSFAFVPFFVNLGLIMAMVGQAEMLPAREYIAQHNITKPLGNYNLHKSYWNEYGSLNTWLKHDVVGLFNKKELIEFLEDGGSVIIPGEGRYKEFLKLLPQNMSRKNFDIYIWKRWLTHGKDKNGKSMFLKYWHSKNIEDIQRDFYIVKLKRAKN